MRQVEHVKDFEWDRRKTRGFFSVLFFPFFILGVLYLYFASSFR